MNKDLEKEFRYRYENEEGWLREDMLVSDALDWIDSRFISKKELEKRLVDMRKKGTAGTDISALGITIYANAYNEALDDIKSQLTQIDN